MERIYKYSFLFAITLLLTNCNEEELLDVSSERMATIECNIEEAHQPSSRTSYEKVGDAMYCGKWSIDDELSVFFDDSDVRLFKLKDGAGKRGATFYGPVPEAYKEMHAIYPADILTSRTGDTFELNIPEKISFANCLDMEGIMPMYAHGHNGPLNFYNLMAVLKLSLSGSGLLKSITITSNDGTSLSGNAMLESVVDGLPNLNMLEKGKGLTIESSSYLLSSEKLEILVPIPAANYKEGLTINFEFDGKTETRELKGPLQFTASVLRPMKPCEIEVPFVFENYSVKNNEIWYRSNAKTKINNDAFNGKVLTNTYSEELGLGVITTNTPITKISKALFGTPKSITQVYFPETLEEIGMKAFASTKIREFNAPSCLKVIGIDAFLGCENLKKVILNDGVESIGMEAFGDCPNLKYVYLPSSIQYIGGYSFLQSTGNLDHWDGDCPLIDDDRHALYANSGYGMIDKNPVMIDVVAGCNLEEYEIPTNVLNLQNYCLAGCRSLKKLIIHENLRGLGGILSLSQKRA